MHTLLKELGSYLTKIVDFCDRDHCVTSQMGVHYNRLRIGVAYYPEPLIAYKMVELVLKFRAEIVSFETVDSTVKSLLRVKCNHSGTLCAKVRMIIGAVEQVIDTWLTRNRAEKASHSV